MKKTWTLMIFSILTIAVFTACSDQNNTNGDSEDNSGQNNAAEENGNADLPEADLDDIPDVVIEVNGEEILKDEFSSMYEQQFQQQIMQAQMSGQDVSGLDQDELKLQTAEILVGQNLLIQEANNRITDVSEDDINATIDLLLEQTGMESKDDLLAIFEEQGMDENEFNEQVETQVKVDQLIVDISKDIELTEEETKEAYETIKAQQEQTDSEEEFPAFDEIKPALEEQLMEQKKAEETQSFVEILRQDADVIIHL